jgi:CDP-glycerol glycerophosphotransferase (TagB/SpsB family)
LEQAALQVIEVMPVRKQWAQWILLLIFVLIAGFKLRPILLLSLQTGAGFALDVLYFLAYLFAVVMLPLMFFVLLKFGYSVFARPYVRAWHINRIRNKRQLKEALQRGRHEE